MKNFKLKRLLSLAFIGCLSTLSATTVFAAAGDPISNTVSLSFKVGTVDQTPVTDTVVFTEDRLVNFTVAWIDGANVSGPSGASAMLTFTVTNNGNGAQDFDLSAAAAAVSAGFDVASVDSIIVDDPLGVSPNAYDGADSATFIDDLAVGSTIQVYVFATMPVQAAGVPAASDLADVTLVATATVDDDLGTPGTVGVALTDHSGDGDVGTEQNVFNDPAGIAPDATKDGVHSDNGTYVYSAANLTITKTAVAIWDPVNGGLNPKAIPGAYVRYTITIANAAGGESTSLTTLGDDLVAELTLDPDYVDGTAAFDANAAAIQVTATSAAEASFEINTNATTRNTKGITYCTAAPAIPDADGCTGSLAAGGAQSIDFTTLAATDADAVSIHAVGELKAGETIVIKFNAIYP